MIGFVCLNDTLLSLLFTILALLVLLGAFFSASETGLMALNRYRLQYLVKQNQAGAARVQRLLQRPENLLAFILLGKTLVTIAAAALTTLIALSVWGETSLVAALSVLILVILVIAEIIPKTLAARKPEAVAFSAAYFYAPILKLCYPVVAAVNFMANACLKLFGIHPKGAPTNALGKEELRTLMAEANALMPPRYHQMMLGIIDLELATVEDVMTPRNDILGIDIDEPFETVMQHIQQSTHTRLPVFKKTIDRVIGFLDLRNLLTLINQPDFDKQAIMDSLLKPVFIPESTPLHKQMQAFKTDKGRIGLVVDEYGDVKGLITLDDLLQEILGELMVDDACIKPQSDGSILVDAGVTVREFNRITHSTLPTKGPKTINGLIVDYMETIPESGTSVNLYGYHLEIIARDGNTIKEVRFHPKST